MTCRFRRRPGDRVRHAEDGGVGIPAGDGGMPRAVVVAEVTARNAASGAPSAPNRQARARPDHGVPPPELADHTLDEGLLPRREHRKERTPGAHGPAIAHLGESLRRPHLLRAPRHRRRATTACSEGYAESRPETVNLTPFCIRRKQRDPAIGRSDPQRLQQCRASPRRSSGTRPRAGARACRTTPARAAAEADARRRRGAEGQERRSRRAQRVDHDVVAPPAEAGRRAEERPRFGDEKRVRRAGCCELPARSRARRTRATRAPGRAPLIARSIGVVIRTSPRRRNWRMRIVTVRRGALEAHHQQEAR